MVRLRAVRAYHPDPERGNASELVSPVYDTLSDEDHLRYGSRRFNAASFTSRPRGVPLSDFLRDAPRRLKEALNAGVYRQDPDPSLYIYGIRFRPEEEIQLELPASDRREEYLLLGLVGGLEISSDDPRDIALHEKVFPDRVEERIRLTDATGTSFAPILAGYTLPSHEVNDLLEEFLGINRRALEFTPQVPPLVEATLGRSVHMLWRLDDEPRALRVQRLLAERRILILDGHHRYTAALARRREGKASLPLTMLVEGHDRALILLPWHRWVSPQVLSWETFRVRAPEVLGAPRVVPGPPSETEILQRLRGLRETGQRGFVAVGPDATWVITGPPDRDEGADYQLLHGLLEGTLGVESREMEFVPSVREALRRRSRPEGEGGVAFLLPPLATERVERTAFETHRVMAQKSTMFLPKVAEGVIFAPAAGA